MTTQQRAVTKDELLATKAGKMAATFDPTTNKDFVRWILREVKVVRVRLPEDGERVKLALDWFAKHKRLLSERDIDKLTIHQLEELVDGAKQQHVEEDTTASIKDATLLFNGVDLKVYRPLTPEAVQHVSRGTKWCTSDRGLAQKYLRCGLIYIRHASLGKFLMTFGGYCADEKDKTMTIDYIAKTVIGKRPALGAKLYDMARQYSTQPKYVRFAILCGHIDIDPVVRNMVLSQSDLVYVGLAPAQTTNDTGLNVYIQYMIDNPKGNLSDFMDDATEDDLLDFARALGAFTPPKGFTAPIRKRFFNTMPVHVRERLGALIETCILSTFVFRVERRDTGHQPNPGTREAMLWRIGKSLIGEQSLIVHPIKLLDQRGWQMNGMLGSHLVGLTEGGISRAFPLRDQLNLFRRLCDGSECLTAVEMFVTLSALNHFITTSYVPEYDNPEHGHRHLSLSEIEELFKLIAPFVDRNHVETINQKRRTLVTAALARENNISDETLKLITKALDTLCPTEYNATHSQRLATRWDSVSKSKNTIKLLESFPKELLNAMIDGYDTVLGLPPRDMIYMHYLLRTPTSHTSDLDSTIINILLGDYNTAHIDDTFTDRVVSLLEGIMVRENAADRKSWSRCCDSFIRIVSSYSARKHMTFEDGFRLLGSHSESIERERQYLLGHLASCCSATTAITLFSHLHCSGVVEASQRYCRDQETMKSYIIFLLAFHAPNLYNDDNAIGWYFDEVLTNPSLSFINTYDIVRNYKYVESFDVTPEQQRTLVQTLIDRYRDHTSDVIHLMSIVM